MTPVGLSEIPLGCMQGLDTGYFWINGNSDEELFSQL